MSEKKEYFLFDEKLTLKKISAIRDCRIEKCFVQDALYEQIQAPVAFIDDGRTAIIETAFSNGFSLIKGKVNYGVTSTYGVGQMIAYAVDLGAKNIILLLGESSTNDCGLGMLAALGASFYNQEGIGFVPTGESLSEVSDMDFSAMYPRLQGAKFIAIYDMDNPLCGENNYSRTFVQQNGADKKMVEDLEKGCSHIAHLFNKMRDSDFSKVRGSGSAGGIAFAVLAGLLGEIHCYEKFKL